MKIVSITIIWMGIIVIDTIISMQIIDRKYLNGSLQLLFCDGLQVIMGKIHHHYPHHHHHHHEKE